LDDDDDMVYKRLFVERPDQSHWSIAKEWARSEDVCDDEIGGHETRPMGLQSVRCWEVIGSPTPPPPPPMPSHGQSTHDSGIKLETDTTSTDLAAERGGSRTGHVEFAGMTPSERVDTISKSTHSDLCHPELDFGEGF
jgi:hypothetical protein